METALHTSGYYWGTGFKIGHYSDLVTNYNDQTISEFNKHRQFYYPVKVLNLQLTIIKKYNDWYILFNLSAGCLHGIGLQNILR